MSNLLAEKTLRQQTLAWLFLARSQGKLPGTLWVPIGSGAWVPSNDPIVRRAVRAVVASWKRDGEFLAGAADILFMWESGCGAIELKREPQPDLFVRRPGGRQSQVQVDFALLCARANIPYVLCRSVEQVQDTLVGWGRLINFSREPIERSLPPPARGWPP